VAHAIICTNCGAKFSAARQRCPRCRTDVPRVDPALVAAQRRRLARIAAGMIAVALVGLAAVWLTADSDVDVTVPSTRPTDPLGLRRQLPPIETPAVNSGPAAAPAETELRFLDPAGAGAVAYQAGDLEAAFAQYQAAIERNPQDAEAMSNLGQVLIKMGRTAEAITHFEKAVSIIPGRWAYRFNLARGLGLLGRWSDSVTSYQEAQRLFPDDYVTSFNLALALHKKGDEAAAVQEYQKAIALQPDDASFRMALAISYETLQKPAEAAAAYGEYLRLSPSAPDADKVRARIAQLTSQGAPAPAPTPPTPPTAPTGTSPTAG
jgi:Flp pilus assembly protein TadD